jgi:hypothetical protein
MQLATSTAPWESRADGPGAPREVKKTAFFSDTDSLCVWRWGGGCGGCGVLARGTVCADCLCKQTAIVHVVPDAVDRCIVGRSAPVSRRAAVWEWLCLAYK